MQEMTNLELRDALAQLGIEKMKEIAYNLGVDAEEVWGEKAPTKVLAGQTLAMYFVRRGAKPALQAELLKHMTFDARQALLMLFDLNEIVLAATNLGLSATVQTDDKTVVVDALVGFTRANGIYDNLVGVIKSHRPAWAERIREY